LFFLNPAANIQLLLLMPNNSNENFTQKRKSVRETGRLIIFYNFRNRLNRAPFKWSQKGGHVSSSGKTRYISAACPRSVIANPQGEAIHTGMLDCFTLRVRNDVCDSLNCTLYISVMLQRGIILCISRNRSAFQIIVFARPSRQRLQRCFADTDKSPFHRSSEAENKFP
jgi:hypothetical protein